MVDTLPVPDFILLIGRSMVRPTLIRVIRCKRMFTGDQAIPMVIGIDIPSGRGRG